MSATRVQQNLAITMENVSILIISGKKGCKLKYKFVLEWKLYFNISVFNAFAQLVLREIHANKVFSPTHAPLTLVLTAFVGRISNLKILRHTGATASLVLPVNIVKKKLTFVPQTLVHQMPSRV